MKSLNLEPEPADPQPLKGKMLAADQAKTRAFRTAPAPIIEVLLWNHHEKTEETMNNGTIPHKNSKRKPAIPAKGRTPSANIGAYWAPRTTRYGPMLRRTALAAPTSFEVIPNSSFNLPRNL